MRPAIGQGEPEEQSFRAHDGAELRGDRDAPAFADERRLLAVKGDAQGTLRGLPHFRIRIGQIPRAAVAIGNLHRHARRQVFSQMRLREFKDFFAELIRHEPKSQFRHGVTGDHGLSPLPLVTAADAVDLRRGPRPQTLERAVTLFAEERGRACLIQHFLVAIEGKFAPGLALPIFQRLHLVVETCDRDAPFLVMQGREQLRQRCDRVRDRAAEHPGMQIHFRARDFDLKRRDPAQAIAQRRCALRDHARIRYHHYIRAQRLQVLREEIAQVSAPDLFFAFDDEVQVNGEVAIFFQRLLDAQDVRQNLSFVIGGPARKNVAVLQDRLKRRRIPKLERVGRLHIIVPVDHDRLAAGLVFILRPYNRMPRRRHQLRFQSDAG